MDNNTFVEQKFSDMLYYLSFLHDYCREGGDFYKMMQANGYNTLHLEEVRHNIRNLKLSIEKTANLD